MDAETKREFDRINKKLNDISASQKKATWISPAFVKKLTEWNHEELRQAREQRIIEFKKSETGGLLYKLESIPEQFIKKQSA